MAHFDLGDNQPLGAVGEAHHHIFAGLQILKAAAAQRLDVDEDVARLAVADHKAIALGAVEPLHLGLLERTAGGGRRRAPRAAAVEAVMRLAARRTPCILLRSLAPKAAAIAVERTAGTVFLHRR